MATAYTADYMTVNAGEVIVEGTIVLTGDYGGASTHGDTLDLSAVYYQGLALPVSGLPIFYSIVEMPDSGTAPTGYIFGYGIGTTLANGVLTVMASTTEYTEASAYSAGLLAAVIKARFVFKSL